MNNRYNPPTSHQLLKKNVLEDRRSNMELSHKEQARYDEIIRRAYEDAYYRGYDAGYNDGYDDGYEDVRYNELNALTGQQKNLKWHGTRSKSWYWL
ncbi:MAG TPA: hypothetical protein VGC65_09795 [Bacteroidia bacterium]|jgi:flagellar biosynthesis/type III secretory pathway protein FliH